ncbi:DNA-binding domain-containing protein [Bacillus sp. S13(2024)]|uniref:DNA-binding domain-containing protein n=1 Tax=unclassified Bacillus (in: firmicutes) TaxID=185979 RepID=UPI003D19D536
MTKQTAIHVLACLQKRLQKTNTEKNLEVEFRKIEKKFQIDYEEVIGLYNKMFMFEMDVKKLGGFKAYELSDTAWLKSELDLLLEVYQFCQQHGMNILSISESISQEKLQLFLKTPSQLQNTYYKLRKQEIPMETIMKQKPGRKRNNTTIKQPILKNEEKETEEKSRKIEKSLVTLLSGIVNNFQTIDAQDEQHENELHHFMEGIYKLSSMAAERMKDEQDIDELKKEIIALRAETEQLRREKEELVVDMKGMTNNIIHFITSSDIEQIRTLPYFVHMCKQELHKLGLYNGTIEGQLKVVIDRSGQVVSVIK